MTREQALEIRAKLEQVAQYIPEEEALDSKWMYPQWTIDETYPAGFFVQYGEKLYKSLQFHTSIQKWNPADAISLWAEILPGQEDTPIGEWVQPDSTNPYMTGDKVVHNSQTWESTIDYNIWEPGVYGWIQITE